MVRIIKINVEGIVENALSFLKRNVVLCDRSSVDSRW